MVSMICEKYGWTIEYVLELTRPQVNALAHGIKEVNRVREEAMDRPKKRKVSIKTTTKTDGKTKTADVTSPLALMDIPGFETTSRAQKAILKQLKDKGGFN